MGDLIIKGQECTISKGSSCYKLDMAKENAKKVDFVDLTKKPITSSGSDTGFNMEYAGSEQRRDCWVSVQSIKKHDKTKFTLGQFVLKGIAIDNKGNLIVKDETGQCIAEEGKNEWLNTKEMLIDPNGKAYWGSNSYGRTAVSDSKQIFEIHCDNSDGNKVNVRSIWIDMKDSSIAWNHMDDDSPIQNLAAYDIFRDVARTGELVITVGDFNYLLRNVKKHGDIFTIIEDNVERELNGSFIRLQDIVIGDLYKGAPNAYIKPNSKVARVENINKIFKSLQMGDISRDKVGNQMINLKNLQFVRKIGCIHIKGIGTINLPFVKIVDKDETRLKREIGSAAKMMIVNQNNEDISNVGEYAWVFMKDLEFNYSDQKIELLPDTVCYKLWRGWQKNESTYTFKGKNGDVIQLEKNKENFWINIKYCEKSIDGNPKICIDNQQTYIKNVCIKHGKIQYLDSKNESVVEEFEDERWVDISNVAMDHNGSFQQVKEGHYGETINIIDCELSTTSFIDEEDVLLDCNNNLFLIDTTHTF